ncbi:MAG: hypothetical protein WDN02_10975 [Methylovirgula sp.]|uniref:hypothetical protein n=1 Tax=Methylovirgula sp. TaxID=1978224 RepID=UPI0030760C30
MLLGRRFLAAAQAGLVLTGAAPAFAGDVPFGPDSDILGIRLSMSRDEARKLIAQNYPGAPISDFNGALRSGDFQKVVPIAFIADLTSKAVQSANQQKNAQLQADERARAAVGLGGPVIGQPGDFGADRIKVLFDPNDGTTDIIGVSRYTAYPPGHQPVTATLLAALKAKYGEPVRSEGNFPYEMNYTWMQPDAWKRTKNLFPGCFHDGGVQTLWDDAYGAGVYTERGEEEFTNDGFLQGVNFTSSGNLNYFARCGVVLQVNLRFVKQGDYVGEMRASLLNLSQAHTELKAYGAAFWKAADEARAKQLNTDAANKPKL